MRATSSVLIVGDCHELQHSLRNALLVAEFDVHVAPSGSEALKLLDRQRIDAAVIDLMMPRLDGVGVCHALLARPEVERPRVVFVISAAWELRRDLVGVRRVFPKPFDARELVEALCRELRPLEQTGT